MKKRIQTILLAIVAVASIIWACFFRSDGLAWFPGFFVSIMCIVGILDINGIGRSNDEEANR